MANKPLQTYWVQNHNKPLRAESFLCLYTVIMVSSQCFCCKAHHSCCICKFKRELNFQKSVGLSNSANNELGLGLKVKRFHIE